MTDTRIFVTQSEVTDGGTLKRREWTVSYHSANARFIEMMAFINGKQRLIGAWDTVRGEALLFDEFSDFILSAPKS